MSAATARTPSPFRRVSPPLPMGALDAAIASMPSHAATATARNLKNGANRMLMRTALGVIGPTFRLYRPFESLSRWHRWEDKSITELLAIAEEKAANLRNLGRERHWAYDYDLHMAWLEACLTLRYLRRFAAVERRAA